MIFLIVVVLASAIPGHCFINFYEMTRSVTNLFMESSFLNIEDMSAPTLIKNNGYPVETHQIHTEDGYILEVHRIPYGKNSTEDQPTKERYPVFVAHGNMQSSADWLINDPVTDSLGFFLADSGYDVWLGNQRGNEYSMGHSKIHNHGNGYWNFSFHEMGIYDVPAVLDYVTNLTGYKKVHYISFSLGSTSFFAGLSKMPEYNDKIGLGIAIGPSTYQQHFWHGWVQLVAPFVWVFQILQKYVGNMPVMSANMAHISHRVLPVICNPKIDVFGLCLRFVQMSMGDDKGKISAKQLHAVTKVAPNSSTMKAFLHEMQLMGTGLFTEFDYGAERNMIAYGSERPPEYNLTNVRANIALMVGPNDFLAHREDAKKLAEKLPNLVEFHYVPYEHFTHLDFCYATDVRNLVYEHIVELLDKYNGK